ncbi:MAG: dipeptidase [Actinobacteria bacterium]|nr:dipeptidase [Actinomycetota bacterium]MBU1942785.1 dipeptidase [Actinomycetota bacterium]MBU2686107.1 dipeptidase [Actinomycetota bacterium]
MRRTSHIHVSEETLEFHRRSLVIDLHTDSLIAAKLLGMDLSKRHRAPRGFRPWMLHADVPKLAQGGVDGVWLGIVTHPWPHRGFARASANIDYAEFVLRKNAGRLRAATRAEDVLRAKEEGRISVMLGVEGMHMLSGTVESIRGLYDRGVRYITLAHFSSNRFAVTSATKRKKSAALPSAGIEAVELMNDLGMLVDVAHVHTDLIAEVCARSRDPVIVSHGAAAAVRPTFRNLTDRDIRDIAGTGGVIGLIYADHWLSCEGPRPTLDVVVDHADHIRELVGVDHLALGSDWDGFIRTPVGMDDATDLPRLTQLFLDRGYGYDDVEKILGLNFMRVFRQVCG